jgi:uncharacterized membrane protein YphA (DoxX/SURF4 family)
MGNHKFIFFVRCVLASVWFYDGLWLKVIEIDRHATFLRILGNMLPHLYSFEVIRVVGWLETSFAVVILSGIFHRFVSWMQILILLFLGLMGLSIDTIHNPVGWAVTNLPLVTCMLFVALFGPGGFAVQWRHKPKKSFS